MRAFTEIDFRHAFIPERRRVQVIVPGAVPLIALTRLIGQSWISKQFSKCVWEVNAGHRVHYMARAALHGHFKYLMGVDLSSSSTVRVADSKHRYPLHLES